MKGLIALITSTIGGGIGWWLGEAIAGMMTAFILSIVGTALGVYYGRRFAQEYLP